MNIETLKATVEILEEKFEIAVANNEYFIAVYEKRLETHGYNDRSAVNYRKNAPANAARLVALVEELAAAKNKLAAMIAEQAPVTTKTYGYDAYKMSKNLTVEQLEAMLPVTREEHALSPEQRTGVNMMDKKGIWKCDQVTWAIYYLTKKEVA